jgi:hypothetical protein
MTYRITFPSPPGGTLECTTFDELKALVLPFVSPSDATMLELVGQFLLDLEDAARSPRVDAGHDLHRPNGVVRLSDLAPRNDRGARDANPSRAPGSEPVDVAHGPGDPPSGPAAGVGPLDPSSPQSPEQWHPWRRTGPHNPGDPAFEIRGRVSGFLAHVAGRRCTACLRCGGVMTWHAELPAFPERGCSLCGLSVPGPGPNGTEGPRVPDETLRGLAVHSSRHRRTGEDGVLLCHCEKKDFEPGRGCQVEGCVNSGFPYCEMHRPKESAK